LHGRLPGSKLKELLNDVALGDVARPVSAALMGVQEHLQVNIPTHLRWAQLHIEHDVLIGGMAQGPWW